MQPANGDLFRLSPEAGVFLGQEIDPELIQKAVVAEDLVAALESARDHGNLVAIHARAAHTIKLGQREQARQRRRRARRT